MKYLVYSFNYPTLCRALRYIDEQWKRENTTLVYASMVSPLPQGIAQEYNVVAVNGRQRSKLNGIRGQLAECFIARESWRAVNSVLAASEEEYTLVVFRDNEAPEATIIENSFRRYGNRLHLWIIEEGVGLYSRGRAAIKKIEVKRLLYRLTGVSLYALANQPQGKNPRVEKVICKSPAAISKKYENSDVEIEQQIDIFVPEFNQRFASYAMGAQPGTQQFDFVFLTTPITDFGGYNESWEERYDGFLRELCRIASKYGKLLIKSHPRDYTDYSKYAINERIRVCTESENSIPFECLHDYFGGPCMITTCSSTCLNTNTDKPSIYVNKLLGWGGTPPAGSVESGVVVCQNYEDLEQVLHRWGTAPA